MIGVGARSRARGALRGGLLVVLAACSPTPGERLKSQVQSFQKEQEPQRLFDRGRAFAQVGDFTRAEEYLEASMDAGQDPRKVMPFLLTVCISSQRYRVAAQHAEEHLKRFPNDVNTRFVLATLYAATGEPIPARRALEQVVAARPNDPESHFALGVLLRDASSERAVADEHFRTYLRLAPAGQHADEARDSLTKPLAELPRLPTVPEVRDADAGVWDGGPVRLPSAPSP